MADGKIFRGQTATLDVETDTGTSITVGALQDVELKVTFEDEKLEGQSLERVDIMRTGVTIEVNATYGTFDLSGLKELIGYDDTAANIEDTPQPPKFTVKGDMSSADGNESITPNVEGVVFNDISLSWGNDSHVEEDLTGEGKNITNL